MVNLNFTLDQIQQLVERELNLKWTDRIVYSHNPQGYHSADLYWDFAFGKPKYLYLRNDKDKRFLAKVQVTNDKFIINLNGDIIDATAHWIEILSQNNNIQQGLTK